MQKQITLRQQQWQTHIKQWQSSSITQSQYCQKHQLKYHQFVYWRSKLNTAKVLSADKKSSPVLDTSFIPVVFNQHETAALSLSLPNGLKIEGINAVSLALSVQLVEALSA